MALLASFSGSPRARSASLSIRYGALFGASSPSATLGSGGTPRRHTVYESALSGASCESPSLASLPLVQAALERDRFAQESKYGGHSPCSLSARYSISLPAKALGKTFRRRGHGTSE